MLLAPELEEHYGVSVDFVSLLNENTEVADSIIRSPQLMLDALETALLTAQVSILRCMCLMLDGRHVLDMVRFLPFYVMVHSKQA